MVVKKRSLEDLFAETTPKWICPVTKKEFDPADAKAIEQHKEDLLSKEREALKTKEELAKKRAILKTYKKLLDTCSNVRDFEKLVNSYLGDLGFAKVKPVFTYLSAKNKANRELSQPVDLGQTWNRACVKITGLSAEAKKGLTAYLGMYNTKDNTFFVPEGRGTKHVSNILRQFYKTDGIKLSDEAKQRLLAENKEYRTLAQQASELAATIHKHREVVRNVTSQMEDIRRGVAVSNHPDDLSY